VSDAKGDMGGGSETSEPAPRFAALCRDCGALGGSPDRLTHGPECGRAPGGARIIAHPELVDLAIAHVDCDAFYASVEKRDRPELAHRPVIVGGGRRGVVTAACYLARRYGVRSAMPMFKALKACPDAVVVKPRMDKYAAVGREIVALMRELTPLVQTVSIDEAFLDLTGTERLHGGPPASALARLARRIETEVGVSVSVGLSWNKYLAKIASELDKPRGFAAIGRCDALRRLAPLPVGAVWGVGPTFAKRLEEDGLRTIGDVQRTPDAALARAYGSSGTRLAALARGEDEREVVAERETRSVSHETTFSDDISELKALENRLWPLCERTAARLREKRLVARAVTLKLKTGDFRVLTRRRTLDRSTDLATRIFETARSLLVAETGGRRYRLIGVGVSDLDHAAAAQNDLFALPDARLAAREAAMDAVRSRFGASAIRTGRDTARN